MDEGLLDDESSVLPVAKLEYDRRMALSIVDQNEVRALAKVTERIERIKERLTSHHRPRFAERRETRDTKHRAIKKWSQLGLGSRLTMLELSPFMRVLLMGFLALVDFFVFARVVAIIADVEPTPSNPEYWFGGVLGLFVSLAGGVAGHLVKKASVRPAQKKLVRELRMTDPNLVAPIPADDGLLAALVGVLIFLAFLAGAAIARFQANADSNIGLTAFQLLLPIMVLLVEYLTFDPLSSLSTRRTWTHWSLERRLKKEEETRASIQRGFAAQRANLENVFGAEQVELLKRLQAMNVKFPPDGHQRVAALLANGAAARDTLGSMAEQARARNGTDGP